MQMQFSTLPSMQGSGFDVVDLVTASKHYATGAVPLQEVRQILEQEAASLGADAVVDITVHLASTGTGVLVAMVGTAIRLYPNLP